MKIEVLLSNRYSVIEFKYHKFNVSSDDARISVYDEGLHIEFYKHKELEFTQFYLQYEPFWWQKDKFFFCIQDKYIDSIVVTY